MPLDTGRITELDHSGSAGVAPDLASTPAPPPTPTLHTGPDLGRALRAVREHQQLTLEDVAALTRVRRVYLTAIEDMQLDQLPSRPFTIGYIRAYASALGLDPDAAVERFKSEEPVLDEPLRAPVGVGTERDPRLVAFGVVAVLIVTAIVLWNVAQRVMSENASPPSTAPADITVQPRAAGAKAGPVALGAPLPAPVESTTPALYETPGLAAAGADGHGNAAPPSLVNAKAADHVPVDPATLPAVFTPKGKIYDSGPALRSVVTLQALQPSSLIIRGGDGSVYFARQLSVGEAYRVPQLDGLVVDVTDPEAFQVFSGGRSRGVLPGAQVATGKLEAPAPAAPPAASPAP